MNLRWLLVSVSVSSQVACKRVDGGSKAEPLPSLAPTVEPVASVAPEPAPEPEPEPEPLPILEGEIELPPASKQVLQLIGGRADAGALPERAVDVDDVLRTRLHRRLSTITLPDDDL